MFDSGAKLCQPEDAISLYREDEGTRKLCCDQISGVGAGFPLRAVLLPGNNVSMELSTATNYAKVPEDERQGFRCTVLGFGAREGGDGDCVGALEDSLAHLAGEALVQSFPKFLHPDKEMLSSLEAGLGFPPALQSDAERDVDSFLEAVVEGLGDGEASALLRYLEQSLIGSKSEVSNLALAKAIRLLYVALIHHEGLAARACRAAEALHAGEAADKAHPRLKGVLRELKGVYSHVHKAVEQFAIKICDESIRAVAQLEKQYKAEAVAAPGGDSGAMWMFGDADESWDVEEDDEDEDEPSSPEHSGCVNLIKKHVFAACSDPIKNKESYDVTVTEVGIVEGKLRMCLSASGGYRLAQDKKFAAMLQKSSVSRQVGGNPLEEVIDFSAEDECSLKEHSRAGDEASSILAFFSLGDFSVPGRYVLSYGGAKEPVTLFNLEGEDATLAGLEASRKIEIEEAAKAREEALRRIQLDESNAEATKIGEELLLKGWFLLSLESATRWEASRPEEARRKDEEEQDEPLIRSKSGKTFKVGVATHEPIYELRRTGSLNAGVASTGLERTKTGPGGIRDEMMSGLQRTSSHGSGMAWVPRPQRPNKASPLSALGASLVKFSLRHDSEVIPGYTKALQTLQQSGEQTTTCLERFAELLQNMRSTAAVHTILQALQKALSDFDPVWEESEGAKENGGTLCNPAKKEYTAGLDTALRLRLRAGLHLVLSMVGELLGSSEDNLLCIMCLQCLKLDYTHEDYALLQDGPIIQGLRAVMNASDPAMDALSPSSKPIGAAAAAAEGDEPGGSPLEEEGVDASEAAVAGVVVARSRNVTGEVEVTASQGAEMLPSLLDGSTETFWQSGRHENNTYINLTQKEGGPEVQITEVSIHMDHTRLRDHKLRSCLLAVGPNAENLTKLASVSLRTDFVGWVTLTVESESGEAIPADQCKYVQLQLTPVQQNSGVRVCCLSVFGATLAEDKAKPHLLLPADSLRTKLRQESLEVFVALSMNVLDELTHPVEEGSKQKPQLPARHMRALGRQEDEVDSSNLQEHILSTLFSQQELAAGKLQGKLVAVLAEELEAEAARWWGEETWRAWADKPEHDAADSLDSIDDSRVFELMGKHVALAGTRSGCRYISSGSLVGTLYKLLLAGTPRVQRQVVQVLSRLVATMPPAAMRGPATRLCMGVAAGGATRLMMLMVAKTLELELRVKGAGKIPPATHTTASIAKGNNQRFPGGHLPSSLGKDISLMLWEMRARLHSSAEQDKAAAQAWAMALDNEVRSALQMLSTISEDLELEDAKTVAEHPHLWLALAALHVAGIAISGAAVGENGEEGAGEAVVGKVFGTSSSWACALLDDQKAANGEVLVVLCSNCGWNTGKLSKWRCEECPSGEGLLCEECDKILHMSKATHGHKRTVIDNSAQLEFRGGMASVRLPWIKATVDINQGKAVVEVSVKAEEEGEPCRFCKTILNASGTNTAPNVGSACFDGKVCSSELCIELVPQSCDKLLQCGHPCFGVRDEKVCPPCFTCDQGPDGKPHGIKVVADDYCSYCFDNISAEPCLVLGCNHVFHKACLTRMLEARWNGARIDFGFMQCPTCRQEIAHEELGEVLESIIALKEEVERKALMRLEYDNLSQCQDITSPGGRFYQDPKGYAMNKFAYFLCYKCNKAYFGGDANCGVRGDFDPSELVCGACANPGMVTTCSKHGDDYFEYKCQFCCSAAVWFCFGTTHFCDPCHNQPGVGPDQKRDGKLPVCDGKHQHALPLGKQGEGPCPLRVPHPPTGEEFPLGCGICRNAQTF